MAVIAPLYGCHHICLLASFSVDELIIGNLDTFPSFIAVHGVETSDDGCYVRTGPVANLLQVSNESFSASRVGVTAVHETVYEGLVSHSIFLGNLDQFEQMVERTMYSSVGA